MKLAMGLALVLVGGWLVAGGRQGGDGLEVSFAYSDAPLSPSGRAAERLKEVLEVNSGGSITVNLYPSGQLGDYRSVLDQLANGEVEMTRTGYPDLSYSIPELKLIGEPYVVETFEEFLKVVQGDYGKRMAAKAEELGLKTLAYGYQGIRMVTSNKPINSVDDMAGLKIRVPNVDFLVDFGKAVGAIPTPIAFNEVYLALQTNQVDAQENPLPTIESMKFYEVQKYIAMTNHFVSTTVFYYSLPLWNELTAEQQRWVEEAAQAAVETEVDIVEKEEADLIADFKQKGVVFTSPDLAPFREAMKPYYAKLEEEFGRGAVEELIKVAKG